MLSVNHNLQASNVANTLSRHCGRLQTSHWLPRHFRWIPATGAARVRAAMIGMYGQIRANRTYLVSISQNVDSTSAPMALNSEAIIRR